MAWCYHPKCHLMREHTVAECGWLEHDENEAQAVIVALRRQLATVSRERDELSVACDYINDGRTFAALNAEVARLREGITALRDYLCQAASELL